ncbi:MAG: hypothetical protein SNH01_07300 [Rikenellaceae bacterium]
MIKNLLLIIAATTMLASCNVNEDFDLSNVDTDNIEIGNEDSEFSLPVANFKINVNEEAAALSSTDSTPTVVLSRASDGSSIGDNISEVLETADAWLPSNTTLDIAKLASDDATVSRTESDRIVDLLLAELKTSEDKRMTLAEKIISDKDEFKLVYEKFGVDPDESAETISATILSTISVADFDASELKDEFYTYVTKYIKDNTSHEISQTISKLDISSVEDLFSDLQNTISIITLITDEGTLPFKFEVESLSIVADNQTISLSDELSMAELISLLNSGDLSIQSKINITEYSSVDTDGAQYLKIILGVLMQGSVKL